jgi:hypothetical protein
MPSRSERARREPGDGASDQQREKGQGQRQEQAAADLSDRAADSVGRRYDATKEIEHGDRTRRGTDTEQREEQ